MNSFDPLQRQESLKRRWQERRLPHPNLTSPCLKPPSLSLPFMAKPTKTFPGFDDDDLVSTLIPPVTVVLEGRSICHRINLHSHASYHSLAKALREMFVDAEQGFTSSSSDDTSDLDLSNAVPGHLIAYEDMENDLLLAGDLNWKDFVRVAKRIRILPVKGNSRKGKGGA